MPQLPGCQYAQRRCRTAVLSAEPSQLLQHRCSRGGTRPLHLICADCALVPQPAYHNHAHSQPMTPATGVGVQKISSPCAVFQGMTSAKRLSVKLQSNMHIAMRHKSPVQESIKQLLRRPSLQLLNNCCQQLSRMRGAVRCRCSSCAGGEAVARAQQLLQQPDPAPYAETLSVWFKSLGA